MLINRTNLSVAIVLLVLLTGTCLFGQDLAGMQLFAPAEVSSYGRGTQPNEGFFFAFDGLYWTISAPRVATVGNPTIPTRKTFIGTDQLRDVLIQYNELDTGDLTAEFSQGNRVEAGRIENNHGWMVSFYQLLEQSQGITAHDVSMTFFDPGSGPLSAPALAGNFTNPNAPPAFIFLDLPLTFTNVRLRNDISSWGIELDFVGRSNQLHNGGFFEWYIGPRYIEYNETFLVNTQGGILSDSFWITEAENHIIAGQIGARLWKKQGRWMISSEGRFLAGLNSQNMEQTGLLGSNLTPGTTDTGQPFLLGPTSINHREFIREFTPGAELRLDFRYQITRSVSFRVGWTGLWLDRIARPSSMINYTIDPQNTHTTLGILRDENRQNVFMNGVIVGIDMNR